MKICKVEAVLLLSGMAFAVSSAAQTNYATPMVPSALRIIAKHPVLTKVRTNANPKLATVEFKLPQGLSLNNYHVLENQAHVTRAASNFTAKSANKVSASLPTGSTLMFVEKESPSRRHVVSPSGHRQLFSTYFVKAVAPARPGEQPQTVSGALNVFADDPILWNAASNAYVAYLTVTFSTDESAANSPFLPLNVDLSGHNVTSIEPRRVELEKANDSKYAVVTCDQYQPDVKITAHYMTTSNTVPLELQKLTTWNMTQMIISKPMLFASLAGGLIGGLLRLFKGTKWEAKRIVHYLVEGITVGLVTVTLLLAGLLQSQVAELSSQPRLVLAFALAAVAGSVGTHFLDKTVNSLRGTR